MENEEKMDINKKEYVLENPEEILDYIDDSAKLLEKLIDQIDNYSFWPDSRRKLIQLRKDMHFIKIAAECLCRGLQTLGHRFDSGPGLQFMKDEE